MTPEQFANNIDKRIEYKEEAKAKEIMTDSRKVRSAVQTEIKDAQKEHPLLKSSSEYRELALAVIESAAAKGKTITLKDACGKVEGLIGKKKDVEQKIKDSLGAMYEKNKFMPRCYNLTVHEGG